MVAAHHVHLDYETRSHLDVTEVGGYVYSRHPTTGIMSAAISLDGAPAELVFNHTGFLGKWKAEIESLARDPSVIWVAHNALFEQSIWMHLWDALFGIIDTRRWRCTAAKAAAMSLPRKLETVCRVLELPHQKNMAGHKVMQKLSKPRRLKTGPRYWEYDDAPDDFEKLYEYNVDDVNAEVAADAVLPDLSPREQEIWFLDQEVNMRGVHVDAPMVEKVLDLYEQTKEVLSNEFRERVDNCFDRPSQVAKLLEWANDNGADLPNLRAGTVDALLGRCPACSDPERTCSDNLHRVLHIRRALSKTSIGKYTAMLERIDPADHRLRDNLRYAGAITKRWGGQGVQLHNMPRGTVNSDVAITHIAAGDYRWVAALYPDIMGMFSSATRGMLTASPGCELFVGDFSSIEAVVGPWLAGQQSTLDLFIAGVDLYVDEAKGIFNDPTLTPKNKYQRSVGKVGVLALGFAGGIGAYGTMALSMSVSLLPAYEALWETATIEEQQRAARAYKMYLKREETKGNPYPLGEREGLVADIIKQRWRKKNPKIVAFWQELEDAAVKAVLTGEKHRVGGDGRPAITYGMVGTSLVCQLPSGGYIVYPFAKVSNAETPWGEKKQTLSYRTEDSQTKQFLRVSTYGGKLFENVVQSTARDLLADSLLRLDAAAYPLVLHVHDEAVADVPTGTRDIKEFEQIMAEVPGWAPGLPVRVEAWKGHRYKK